MFDASGLVCVGCRPASSRYVAARRGDDPFAISDACVRFISNLAMPRRDMGTPLPSCDEHIGRARREDFPPPQCPSRERLVNQSPETPKAAWVLPRRPSRTLGNVSDLAALRTFLRVPELARDLRISGRMGRTRIQAEAIAADQTRPRHDHDWPGGGLFSVRMAQHDESYLGIDTLASQGQARKKFVSDYFC